MNSVVVRTLFSLFVPGGLIFFATALLLHTGLLDKSLSALVHIYPYVVAAAGILLGWRFNRSRLVFAILVLALADRALLYFAGSTTGSIAAGGMGRTVYNTVAFLLPLNLAALSLMKERGMVTFRGMVRLSLIFVQVVIVFLICRYPKLGASRPHTAQSRFFYSATPLSPSPVGFRCGISPPCPPFHPERRCY